MGFDPTRQLPWSSSKLGKDLDPLSHFLLLNSTTVSSQPQLLGLTNDQRKFQGEQANFAREQVNATPATVFFYRATHMQRIGIARYMVGSDVCLS